VAAPPVWTIGHSNHALDVFLGLLGGERIELVADVRSHPYSRFAPHFNRARLEPELAARGVGYAFLGRELGGRPALDEHYDDEGHALYGPMSETPAFREAVDRVLAEAGERRVALLCSESDPVICHRRLLVGKVLADRGAELRHILRDGSVSVEMDVALVTPWRSPKAVRPRSRGSRASP
jgi:uncharacterized protein (DUF488 family)